MSSKTQTVAVHTFELRRLSDDLVYVFHRVQDTTGEERFVREDRGDLFIEYSKVLGWVALDPKTGQVTGRPWNDDLRHNVGQPPQGEWVSKKGSRSYVYELRYVL